MTQGNDNEKSALRYRILGVQALPALPDTVAAMPDTGHHVPASVCVVGLLRRDPGLAAKVLRLANASVFEDQATCNLDRACEWLGARGTSAVLREALMQPCLPGHGWVEFQRRCVITALAARCIAAALGHREPEELYTAGLLHGLGFMALAAATPPDGVSALDTSEAGGLLGENWQLPQRIIDCMQPRRDEISPTRETHMVQLAAVLAENFGSKDREQNRLAAAGILELARALDIAPAEMGALLKQIQQAVERDQKEQRELRQQIEEAIEAKPSFPLNSMADAVAEAEPVPDAIEISRPAAPLAEPASPLPLREHDMPESVTAAHEPAIPEALAEPESPLPAPILTPVADWERGSLRVRGTSLDQARASRSTEPTADNKAPRDNAEAASTEAGRETIGRPRARILLAAGLGIVLLLCILMAKTESPSPGPTGAAEIVLPTREGEKKVSLGEAVAFVSLNPIAPESPGYLSALGKYYDAQHNDPEATKYFQQLANDYPAWPGTRDIYLPLAACYDRAHNTEAATRIYRLIIKTFPANSEEYLHAKARLDATP